MWIGIAFHETSRGPILLVFVLDEAECVPCSCGAGELFSCAAPASTAEELDGIAGASFNSYVSFVGKRPISWPTSEAASGPAASVPASSKPGNKLAERILLQDTLVRNLFNFSSSWLSANPTASWHTRLAADTRTPQAKI
jgi:hypothetical protein